MDITFARCEQILGTLPIGYYAGRRIGVSLKDDIPTSYYCPAEDTIDISYPIIKEGVSKIDKTEDIEGVVRSMMYHEVSHAILTPEKIDIRREQKDAINIFEDERIETLLRNYYHGVNFRKQVYDLNGGIHKPHDATSAFYNAVRFGIAPKVILDDVNRIIARNSKVNRNSDYYETHSYIYDVWDLYKRVAREWERDPEQFSPESASGGDGENKFMEAMKMTESENDGEESNEEITVIQDAMHDLTKDVQQIKDLLAAGLDIKSRLNQGQIQDLRDLEKTAETIINNFNKKNTGGSGINTYSGVFNPRAIARGDYRYFERSSSIQGNNKFGTCHLNLFIDCSGSFYGSEALINGVLEALSAIERKNRNFTMDVVFCGMGTYVCQNKHERRIHCDGGNELYDDMKQVFLNLQKQNTCNYNIVLFDGDAFSDYRGSDKIAHCSRIFSAFDFKQTTLITDDDNVRYMGPGFTNAKVVVTNHYTQELIKHITKALSIAFS